MSAPNVRLQEAMRAAGFKGPSEVAHRYRDINLNSITSHANGNRPLTVKAAEKYAKLFDCSAAWLLLGEGEPPGNKHPETEAWLDRIRNAAMEAVISKTDPNEVVNALLDVIDTIRQIAKHQPERIPVAKEVLKRAGEQSRTRRTSDKEDTEGQH